MFPIAGLAALILLLAPSLGWAQNTFEWPTHPKNAKVLPKNITSDQLRETMVGFTRALGVRCQFCHVGEEGRPLTTFDFVSDKKPEKQVARSMFVMLGHVRNDLKKMKLEGTTRVNMGCQTCHHGHSRPTTLAEQLTGVYDKSGIDSVMAAYQKLRLRYYGRDAYDFSEGSLIDFGSVLIQKGRPEDAIRVNQLNIEQNPRSARAYEGLGDAYEAAGQKDRAVEAYRNAVQLDPEDRNAQRRLDALQGAPSK